MIGATNDVNYTWLEEEPDSAKSECNDRLSLSDSVLLEQANLCCCFEVSSRVEIDKLLWQAFTLGKKYRDAGGKE